MTASIIPAATVLQVGIRQRSLRRHCRLGRATELVFILATGATLALGGQAEAQDRTWDAGDNTTNWLTLNNWAGAGAGRVPDTLGENALITGSGGANQPVLGLGDAVTVGATTVSGGVLTIDGSLTSPVTVSGTGTLTNNGTIVGNVSTTSATAALNNNSTLTGNLTVNGGAANNAGDVSGTTEVSAGTLTLSGASDLADLAQVTVSGTGTLAVGVAETVGALVQSGGTVEGAGQITATTYAQSGGDMAGLVETTTSATLGGGTISGTLSGAGAVTVQTGTTTVTGTIDGDVTVASAGVLRLDSVTAVSGTITTTGSTVSYADGQDEDSALIISSATTDLEVLAGEAATQSGVISSTGDFGFEKTGAGDLTVSGINTYTGVTEVSAGTLTVSNDSGLGATGAGNETTVDAGATLALTGGIASGEAITLNGTGVSNGGALRNLSGDNVIGGAVTLASDTRINSDAGQLQFDGVVTGAGMDLTIGGTGTTLITTGITTGTGSLTVDATTATGVVALQGASTFTGGTTVNSGFLQLGGGTALADSGALTINAPGTVQVFDGETVGALSGDGTIILQTAGALVAGDGTDTEFSGTIQEFGATGAFTKAGTGTLTLSGVNAYTGTTTVDAGTLALTGEGQIASTSVVVSTGASLTTDGGADGGGIIDTAAVTLNGTGNLTLTGSETIASLASGSGTSTVTLNANTLTLGGSDTTSFAGAISGTGGLTRAGTGTTTLTGANDYTGTTTVSGGRLNFETGGATFDTGDLVVNGGTLGLDNAILTVDSLSGSGGTIALSAAGGASELTFGSDNSTTSFSGDVTGTALTGLVKTGVGTTSLTGDITTAGTVTVSGGTLVLSGDNTIDGGIFVDGKLRLESDNAAGGASGLITTTGSVIDYANGVDNVTDIQIASNTTQVQVTTGSAEQSGVIGEDAAGRPLEKIGAGELVLSAANTFTGDMTVTGGTLSLSGGSALEDSVNLILADGTTVNVQTSEVVGSVASVTGGTVALGANSLTLSGAVSTSFAGNVTGGNSSAFVSNFGNTITMTGDSTMTGTMGTVGGTMIMAAGATTAAIQVGGTGATGVFTTNGGALASNAELVNLSTATININGSETIGSIEQTSGGTINVAGGATLTVNGSTNAFNLTGASTIGNDVLGAGTLNVTGGTTTVGAGGNVATATTIGAGGAVVNNGAMAGVGNAGSFTNNGTAGALTNTGAGTGSNTGTLASLTHSSSALFTNTNVITGNVTVNSGTVTLSGASNIGNASTVTVNNGILNAGVADTIGGLVANGGTTNVSAQLTMGELSGTSGSIATTGTGALIVGDSDAVDSSFGGVISGAGTLQKVGTDTLTLTGANTLSGGVTVTQGTLALTVSGGLANGAITIDPTGSMTTDGGAFGSAVTITNNGLPAAVAAPFGLMLTAGGDETIASLNGNGTTNLSSGSVLSLNAGTSDVAGVVSGAGGLTVTGTSTTNLTVANTYTGDTVVNGGGALNLNGVGAIASAVVTISGNGALTTDGDGIADTAAVSVAGANGILRVNGTETIGSLTQTGGFVNGTSTLTTTSFDQTGGTTSGTVTVSTGTFTQNGGTIGTGTTVTQSGGATMSGGTVAGLLTGAGTVTVQTGTTTVTGTIASTNVTVASGELSLDAGEGLTTATDLTVNGGLVDVNTDEVIATLSGSGGSVDIDAAGSLTLGEATLDTATYAGNVTGAGDLIKLGTNTQVFSGANGLTGTVDVNAGTLRITGTIAATDLETAAAGTLETDGGALVDTAVVTNAGTFRITAGTETIASVNGAGGIDLNTGNLTLAGVNSTISGAVSGSGTLTVNAAADGDATGGATVILSGDSSAYTGTAQVTEGTLRVTATGNLGGPVNVATLGLFQLEGGTLSDSLTNTGGRVEARGTIDGNVTNNNVGAGGGGDEGIFTITGNLTFVPAATRTFTNAGTVLVNSGSILGLGSFTNQSGGETTVQGGRTLQATTVTNDAGALMALNGGTVDGNLVNNGTLQSDGSSVITGNLTNGGAVDLDDGLTGDVLTVNGGISGSGTYLLDLNLNNGTSDLVAGTANTAGNVNLVFNRTGAGYIGTAVTVFSGAAAGASVTGSAALPVGGSIIYTLDQVGSDVVVQSQVNPAVGGVAASASMTQALIGTIVNRPTSPFVSGLAAEEGCSQGGYFRATGGRATVAGESSSNGFTTNNSISSDFYGVQGGYDVGCFDGRFFDGWDGAAGLMLGYNAGSTDQSLFSDPTRPALTTGLLGTDFTQNYIGLYVAGAKDRLSADLQLRYDDTSFDLNEVTLVGAPVGLDGLSYSTKATTIGTRVSYRMDVNEEKGINFVPTAGFNLTHVSGDTLTLAGGETLEIEAFTSVVGFVGGALARTFIAEDGGSATTAFVSGNYYQDFGGDRGALFDIDGDGVNPQDVSVASIGGFGELSLGVNYVKVLDAGTAAGAKQLNASIRGDLRVGQNVSDAYSVTAQVRLSF
ncbi:hypothetical protein MASR2M74_12080 [Paracoccaceae bacterium]